MEAPDFWDNAEISQKKMKELKSMKDDMETYQNLVTQKEDMETLIEMSYEENDPSMIEEIQEMAEKIHKMGPKKIAITGIVQGGFIANFCYEEGQQPKVLRTHKEGTQRSGTGDIFASIIAADAVNGVPFYKSVKKASDFIKKCIIRSQELNIPLTDGVCFEEVLGKLKTD